MENSAIVVFKILKRNFETDLEIPINISANDLVNALNKAYDLGIDTSDVSNCYLKSERPIAFLKGSKKIKDFGIRNGTVIYFTE